MHSVLNLEADWSDAQTHESFEETLVQTSFRGLFAHDNGSKLAVITHKDYVLCALQNWNKRFRLGRLRGFIHKYLPELHCPESTIESGHRCGADDIGAFEDFIFSLSFKIL